MTENSHHLNSRLPILWHGGDYNPEQWSRQIWDEDMKMMQESNFKVATLGVFSWVSLEPSEGAYEFEWLDTIIAKLTDADRWFTLATPSAAPPAWMSKKYPEILRTGSDRVRRRHGNRVNYNLASGVYREKTREIARKLAERYGDHPRLLAWHVSNEYGGADYGAESVSEFQSWLKKKYRSLEQLNKAYWTAFWSHTYTDWSEIEPPGLPYSETSIAALTVDWQRFVTDQTIGFMNNEAAPLRALSPHVPITTNFMGTYPGLDYRKFSEHLDFTCWDSYPAFSGALTETRTWIEVAFKHDLTRCLSKERRWALMECSPSSSNWYSSMSLKKPGMHEFEVMQAIAHGADGVLYFQWRQSRGSQEQYHGAVVGHAGGSEARVFKDVARAGAEVERLGEVAGSTSNAEVAVIYDWEVRWALDAACGPVQKSKGYEQTCIDHYQPFWELGIQTDVIGTGDSFSNYKIVVAPMVYSFSDEFALKVEQFVREGGIFVTTYLSGWTDENSLVFEGGFLAPLKNVLGLWSEEIDVVPFAGDNCVRVDSFGSEPYGISDFCELIHPLEAEVLGTFGTDFYAGRAALTVNRFGEGRAYYVASRNEIGFTRKLVETIVQQAGLSDKAETLPNGVTIQRRSDGVHSWLFVMNASPDLQQFQSRSCGSISLEPWGYKIITDGGAAAEESSDRSAYAAI